MTTRSWCTAIHELTNKMGDALSYFLGKLERSPDTGWSPDSLPLIQMEHDAKALRAMAEWIDARRAALIGKPKQGAAE